MPVNDNFKEVNVEKNLSERNSVLHIYQKLIHLRNKCPLIVQGDFKMLFMEHPQIFAYERSYRDEVWLIMANFSEEICCISVTDKTEERQAIISSTGKIAYDLSKLKLEPFEAFVVKR